MEHAPERRDGGAVAAASPPHETEHSEVMPVMVTKKSNSCVTTGPPSPASSSSSSCACSEPSSSADHGGDHHQEVQLTGTRSKETETEEQTQVGQQLSYSLVDLDGPVQLTSSDETSCPPTAQRLPKLSEEEDDDDDAKQNTIVDNLNDAPTIIVTNRRQCAVSESSLDDGAPPRQQQRQNQSSSSSSFTKKWTKTILWLQAPVRRLLTATALHAANHPILCIVFCIVLSVALLAAGVMTNFRIEKQEENLWTPRGSRPEQHDQWIEREYFGGGGRSRNLEVENDEHAMYYDRETLFQHVLEPTHFWNSRDEAYRGDNIPWEHHLELETDGFARQRRRHMQDRYDDGRFSSVFLLVHADGANVVSQEGVAKQFEVLDRVRRIPGYADHCDEYGSAPCPYGVLDLICFLHEIPLGYDARPRVCDIVGMTAFWLHNTGVFEQEAKTDYDVYKTLGIDVFPGDEEEFDITTWLGYAEFEYANNTRLLVAGKSFVTYMPLPGPALWLEDLIIDEITKMQDEWNSDPENIYRVELLAYRSFEDETVQAVYNDLPLTPFVAILMAAFTALVFFKRNWVGSRTAVGFGAVVCVMLSLLSGYGLMFIFGIPFTNLQLALLFIVFGIGLDDSFIMYSSYVRSNESDAAVKRIEACMTDVGTSILMTTATTQVAFLLGCLSPLPAIRWLCIYAFTTIGIDFIYQITFFISLLVLDEARVTARRKDCLCCCKVPLKDGGSGDHGDNAEENGHPISDSEASTNELKDEPLHLSGRVMSWYADKLLLPWVKAVVIVAFAILFGVCVWSTTQLRVNFDFRSILPADSYVIGFYDALNAYTNRQGPSPYIYFRNVNQSDPEIWKQMDAYVDAIVATDAVTNPPFRYWLRDYKAYVAANEEYLEEMPFNDRLTEFLSISENDYYSDIRFDGEGNIFASRTRFKMDNIDAVELGTGVDAVKEQRAVTKAQPVNQPISGDWAFFTFAPVYLLWEFLLITPDELTHSTVYGLCSVMAMSILFIPHWSGILFVAPMMMVLYVDLMGFIEWFGVSVNGLSYVSLLMAIGLLVDYVMHVVLRYYESTEMSSRDARVKDVLKTMGASVLLGGLSTFLGVIPLMFSSSDIIFTFVATFFGVVFLGLSHGLVLLPVILSLMGPMGQPIHSAGNTEVKSGDSVVSETQRVYERVEL